MRTRKIKIGNIYIGGNSPVAVQSMTKTFTRDVKSTVSQIKRLEGIGCELIRCAVRDMEDARALGEIKKRIHIPLIADIHFDYRLALEAIRQGVDKVRINPGNIGGREKVAAIVKAAKSAKIPIRIGVNSGSLKTPHASRLTPHAKAKAMVSAALEYVKICEEMDFHDIVVSLKASDVLTTIQAYRLFAQKRIYPLHLGITEAGPPFGGGIKSAVGLGILLSEGIGDTIRVSLTAEPIEEIKAGYEILRSLGLRSYGVEIISCPTCGRCQIPLEKIVKEVQKGLNRLPITDYRLPIKVAVMGCVVNGPGEARGADIGIAGGKGFGVLFKKGKPIKKVPEKDLVKTLIQEIKIISNDEIRMTNDE